MSDKLSEIKSKLKEVVGANPNYPITGTVTIINGETCSVKLVSGLVISDVRLKATVSEGDDYLLLEPVIGSEVLMLSSDGTLSNLSVIKVDKVAKFTFSQSGLKVVFDSTDKKVNIENANANFKEILTDLATLLKQLKVFTPNGPSGVPLPPTITAITQFESKVNQLFK